MNIQLNLNSFAVILYCSDIIPTKYESLTNEEWLHVEQLMKKSSMKTVSRLFGMNFDTLHSILGVEEFLATKIMLRNRLMPELFHALYHLEQNGINVTTYYESNYPDSLRLLKKRMPFVLFYLGDLSLLDNKCISIVGPQQSQRKLNFSTKNLVMKCFDENYTLISSGIKGVDAYASRQMLRMGGKVIFFVSDHLFDMKNEYRKKIESKQVLLISAVDPFSYFNVTNALDRNIYICGLSLYQFVIATKINSGAVWFTSMQNMHYHWTKQIVLDDASLSGNIRLKEMGVISCSDDDLLSLVSIEDIITKNTPVESKEELIIDQMSIYEFLEDKND